MGGREVGGLANMLAAHMGFSEEERDRVRRFWNAPNVVTGPGLKAVDMFDAVADGRIKALWVMGTNPAVSLPRADAVREALAKLDLLVVSENVASNDTVGLAHVRLPAAAWGEKDGTVTNSERRISRQRAFLPLPGEARPDWWILSQVARRLGLGEAFAYASPAEIFDEHARLSGFENDGHARLRHLRRRRASTARLTTPWSRSSGRYRRAEQADASACSREGGFFTPDRKARFVAIAPPRLAAPVSADWPFLLNTGRIRDQWHTMTRTGLSPRLSTHIAEPFVEIHPDDAARLGLEQGTLAQVAHAARRGHPARAGQPRPAAGHAVRADPLVGREQLRRPHRRAGAAGHRSPSPASPRPRRRRRASHRCPWRTTASPCRAGRCGFRGLAYWAAARAAFGHVLNFAFDGASSGTGGWRAWLASALPEGERVTFEDAGAGVYRVGVHARRPPRGAAVRRARARSCRPRNG